MPTEDTESVQAAAPNVASGPPTITLDKCSATLEPPGALLAVALCISPEMVESLDNAEIIAIQAAALRMCWPDKRAWPTTPSAIPPTKWTMKGHKRLAEWGHEVFDQLHRAGIPVRTIMRAGSEAHAYATSTILTEDEVREAQGFSGAPAQGG